jgi:hypothetical protein
MTAILTGPVWVERRAWSQFMDIGFCGIFPPPPSTIVKLSITREMGNLDGSLEEVR